MLGHLFRKKSPSLTRQLEDLRACGVKLFPSATEEALLAECTQDEFAREPYQLVLVTIGDAPPRPENIWHFDTECIEDHGDYARIAKRFAGIAGGDFPLTDVHDFVNVEPRQAWVAFKLYCVDYCWTCKVDDDWVDSRIIFAVRLAPSGAQHGATIHLPRFGARLHHRVF